VYEPLQGRTEQAAVQRSRPPAKVAACGMAESNKALIKVGVRASVTSKEEEYGPGTIRYVGTPKFQPGEWVGIELDKPSTNVYYLINLIYQSKTLPH